MYLQLYIITINSTLITHSSVHKHVQDPYEDVIFDRGKHFCCNFVYIYFLVYLEQQKHLRMLMKYRLYIYKAYISSSKCASSQ